jgi:oxygen-independent coproporphyrinogen-3 oxidase
MEVLQRGNEGMICRRRTNPGDFTAYEQMVNSSGKPAEETLVLPAESRFETLMLGLRMNDGVDENEFEKMHGTPLDMIYGEKLRKFESQGLMIHSGHAWKLTRRGFDIQNSILVEFMED